MTKPGNPCRGKGTGRLEWCEPALASNGEQHAAHCPKWTVPVHPLRAERERQGLSTYALAARARISRKTTQRIEGWRAFPRQVTQWKLHLALLPGMASQVDCFNYADFIDVQIGLDTQRTLAEQRAEQGRKKAARKGSREGA